MPAETLAMKAFTIRSQDPEKQKAKDESHEIIKKGIAKDVRSHLCTSLHVPPFFLPSPTSRANASSSWWWW